MGRRVLGQKQVQGAIRGGGGWYWHHLPCLALSLTSRLGIQQLQLVRGPHRILLTAQELTFIHRPPRMKVGVQAAGRGGRHRAGGAGSGLRPVWALDCTCPLQRLHVDNASESRSVADGGGLTSAAQGSARSLPAPLEPTSVVLFQVRAPATPQARVLGQVSSVWEKLREPIASRASVCPTPATEWETGRERDTDFPRSHSKLVAGFPAPGHKCFVT